MIQKHLQPFKHLHLKRYTIHIKHQTIESGHQLMDPAVYHLNKSLCSTIPKTMHFLNDIIPPKKALTWTSGTAREKYRFPFNFIIFPRIYQFHIFLFLIRKYVSVIMFFACYHSKFNYIFWNWSKMPSINSHVDHLSLDLP